MEGKGSFIVLLIVIVVLSVCLAAVVGYLLTQNVDRPSSETTTPVTDTINSSIDYKKVQRFRPFKGEAPIIGLRNSEGDTATHVIRLKMEILVVNAKVLEEVSNRESEINDFLHEYFSGKTYDELNNVENRKLIKADILAELNRKFPPLRGEKVTNKFLEIYFEDWFVQ